MCTLPFWDEAAVTARTATAKMQARAELEADSLIHQAIALQGLEEVRPSQLLGSLPQTYDVCPPSESALTLSTAFSADIE